MKLIIILLLLSSSSLQVKDSSLISSSLKGTNSLSQVVDSSLSSSVQVVDSSLISSSLRAERSGEWQSPDSLKAYTLQDCMSYAVSNSTKMRIAAADTKDAQISHREAIIKAFTPQIGAYLSTNLGYGRVLDSDTNIYIDADAISSSSMSLEASLNLFNGFEAVNNIKFTNTLIQIGIDNEELTRAKICLATMEAYYNLVYYSRLTDILASQVEASKQSLELVKKQEALGTKSYTDIVEINAQLAEREYDLINTDNKRKDALITLKDLMFWPSDEELLIDTSIQDEEFSTLDEPLDKSELVQFALNNQASVKVALSKMQNAKLSLTTAKLAFLPSLSFGVGIGSRFSNPWNNFDRQSINNQISQNTQKYLGLSLSIPIFTRWSYISSVGHRKVAYEKASAEYDQKLKDVEAEVNRAVQDRDSASSAYLQAERKAEFSYEAYMLNQKKYDQGLISALELQTSTNNYLKAQADKINSLFRYLIKKQLVNYYNGIDFY